MSEKKGLFQKIARIMGRLERLPKTGYNDHFKYTFVTDADVSDTIRKELADENIAFFASMVESTQEGNHTVAEFEFTFACADTGETMVCLWSGEANDKQDKGLSKAATSAEKYFFLKTFVLSTGDKADDPDNDGNAAQPARPEVRQKRETTPPARDNNDSYPTIGEYWPDVAKGLLKMQIKDWHDGLPSLGGIVYAPVKQMGYKSDSEVKKVLGFKSSYDFDGTLEELLDAVLEHAPIQDGE